MKRLSMVLFLAFFIWACKRMPGPGIPGIGKDTVALRETADPVNQVHSAVLKNGRFSDVKTAPLAGSAFVTEPNEPKPGDPSTPQPPSKLHPVVQEWLRTRPDADRVEVLISFVETAPVPRFPEPAVYEPRDSATNKKALARSEEIVKSLIARRSSALAQMRRAVDTEQPSKEESFWLAPVVSTETTIRSVRAYAALNQVTSIRPRFGGEVPPQNGNNNDDVQDGRARMVSDPYFNLGLTRGFIGLLDTGMRFTHRQFNGPSNIDFRRDCVNGGANCNTGANLNPNDDCWNHGTSSAAIITANNRDGDAFRGVTGVTLDSFKVYPTSRNAGGACNGFLDGAAAVRGFQTAVAVLDRVIVAEMQGGGNDQDPISVAADAAFDAGAVIIAANGNNGPNASTVNVPAIAHRVIGVGNFDVQTQTQIAGQSRGPAGDNRIKPDIQAPTQTETASNASDTAFRNFSGTSGATPYASGAAALLRNWLRGASFSIDPGQVYAQLILSGQNTGFDNTTGAGPLRLPTDGWAWWGVTNVTNGQTVNISLGISGASANTFDGALWWPETAGGDHNDIDLRLVDPGGTSRASSISIDSIFERARVSGAIVNGNWTLRIRGFNVRSSSQRVYWAAHVRLR